MGAMEKRRLASIGLGIHRSGTQKWAAILPSVATKRQPQMNPAHKPESKVILSPPKTFDPSYSNSVSIPA